MISYDEWLEEPYNVSDVEKSDYMDKCEMISQNDIKISLNRIMKQIYSKDNLDCEKLDIELCYLCDMFNLDQPDRNPQIKRVNV